MKEPQTTLPNPNKSHPSIYSALITKKTTLTKIQPTKQIPVSSIHLQAGLDAKMNALKYRYPLKYLGKDYCDVVVPCTPAYELSQKQQQEQQQEQEVGMYSFVKVNENGGNGGVVQAFASGKRSAIYCDGGKLIRLKGCGNEDKGFNRENNQSRGHHFYHTAKRQLHTTQKLNKIFKNQLKIDPPANIPLYAYNFPNEEISRLGLANDLPLISKYCCVFQTQGDRRAGTHLISPLELLFLTLVDHEKADWGKLFVERGRIDFGELVEFVTNYQLMVNPGQKFMDAYNSSPMLTNYITLSQTPITLHQTHATLLESLIHKLTPSNTQIPLSLVSKIKWSNFPQICETLLERIGYEMGQIKRTMCLHEASWGFYLDHGVEWHCNAHLNNFVVTRPQHGDHSFFMLPLDYDLAYFFEEFVCIDLDSQHYGHSSGDVFQNYLMGEFSAMEMSLFGLEMMNFKYGIDSVQYTKEQVRMSKIAFRDTLVRAFNCGMRNKEDEKKVYMEKWNNNIDDISNLVELCLWLSVDFQT